MSKEETKSNIGWVITHIDAQGRRIMMYPHRAALVFDTELGAYKQLVAMYQNNNNGTMIDTLGDLDKVEIRQTTRYDSGDPSRVIFKVEEEEA